MNSNISEEIREPETKKRKSEQLHVTSDCFLWVIYMDNIVARELHQPIIYKVPFSVYPDANTQPDFLSCSVCGTEVFVHDGKKWQYDKIEKLLTILDTSDAYLVGVPIHNIRGGDNDKSCSIVVADANQKYE
jgi:hypothetical protein